MVSPKDISSWLIGDVTRRLKEEKITIDQSKLTPGALVQLLFLIEKGIITGKITKTFIVEMIHGKMPIEIIIERLVN